MLYSVNYLDNKNIYSGVEIEADSTIDLFNKLIQYSKMNKYKYSRVGRIKEVLEIIELN